MKRFVSACAVAAVAMLATAVAAQVPAPPDESKTRGHVVPDVTLVDDHGTTFRLSELGGKPLLVSPIFTHCQGACIAITSTLKDAVASAGTIGTDFNVLTLSFDPADSVESMHAYREAHQLPDAWKLAVASAEDRTALLDAIDFHFVTLDGGAFNHVNEVAVLDRNLAVSGYLHGTFHTKETVVAALQVANGKRGLEGRGNLVLLVAVVGIIASLVSMLTLLTRRRLARTAP